jgi:enediyne biosynthesis protein E4
VKTSGTRFFQIIIGPAIVAIVLGAGLVVRGRQYQSTPHVAGAELPTPSMTSLPFKLTEVSRSIGVVHKHDPFVPHPSLANVAPMLTGLAGASVAVVDYDNDGFPDIYFTNQARNSKNTFLHNKGDGTFEDVSDRSGLGDVNQAAGSLRGVFFDFDNDGNKDLILTTTYCPRFFRNKGEGTFEDITKKVGIEHCGYSYGVNVLDYDDDGYLDLVIGDYYADVDLFNPSTTKFFFNRLVNADNGGPILVYHNERNGTFKQVPDSLGIKSRGFTHAIGVYDLRGTGKPDLYFATDFNADQLYFNDGHGHFTDASDRFFGKKYSRFGMNAEIADIDNDGRPAVFVTDIHQPVYIPSFNGLWKITADGILKNEAEERGVARCGWAWGAKFVDLDNDSNLDLVVTNGMISLDRNRDYWFKSETIKSGIMQVLQDSKNWPAFNGASLAGYQKKCAYYKHGNRFEDITALTPLAQDEADGRGLATIDLQGTGSLSLVEATVGNYARFYRNEQLNKNHWIGFDLTGTRSNRDAFGAQVTVKVGGVTLRRELQPANGFQAESDHRLHFGLGPEGTVQSVTIRWPNGAIQELKDADLGIDRYHKITEPQNG